LPPVPTPAHPARSHVPSCRPDFSGPVVVVVDLGGWRGWRTAASKPRSARIEAADLTGAAHGSVMRAGLRGAPFGRHRRASSLRRSSSSSPPAWWGERPTPRSATKARAMPVLPCGNRSTPCRNRAAIYLPPARSIAAPIRIHRESRVAPQFGQQPWALPLAPPPGLSLTSGVRRC